jgi:argininosuccinate lyase
MQIIKEVFIPAFEELNDCLIMTNLMLSEVKVNESILQDKKYDYLFSVEEVNNLTIAGIPFRDAYKQVGLAIEAGDFNPDKTVNHTHEGSIGNLCNDKIEAYKNGILNEFNFDKVHQALKKLIG